MKLAEVNLKEILQHELLSVPKSVAEMNGSLFAGQKLLLADELTKGINCPAIISLPQNAALITDGQAVINTNEKPDGAKTFGDFAEVFSQYVF